MRTTVLTIALALLAMSAAAEQLTFIHEGSGSGTLDGSTFPASAFVITAVVDTDDRTSFTNGWSIGHLSASITIDGLGTFDFISATRTFVNNGGQIVGFSRNGISGMDLFDGPENTAFADWDMLSPIGPISGDGYLMQWDDSPQINTSGGSLFFNEESSDATFTAIPEPATIALLLASTVIELIRRRP